MWERVVGSVMPMMASLLPPGSRVLEVGYGDGKLTCFLARCLGWYITGLEIRREAFEEARASVERLGLADRVDLRLLEPYQTREHSGHYDGVFIKTVLYSSRDRTEYLEWLEWIAGVLKPRGVFVNFETGRANSLTQFYRRLRGREYVNSCLYTADIERLYDERFEVVYRRYYGGYSQFAAPVPYLYEAAAWLERTLKPRSADNCFAVAMICRKREDSLCGNDLCDSASGRQTTVTPARDA